MYAEGREMIELDVIPYEKLIQGDFNALQTLDKALHEKGLLAFEEYLVRKKNTNNTEHLEKLFSDMSWERKNLRNRMVLG